MQRPDRSKQRHTEHQATYHYETVQKMLSEIDSLFPDAANPQVKADFLSGEIAHIRFNDPDRELLKKILENSANSQDPRTYSQHGALHKVYELVLLRLIEVIDNHPQNICMFASAERRKPGELPVNRLKITVDQPLRTSQEQGMWAALGCEIAGRDTTESKTRNRAKIVRKVADAYGVPFAVLTALYANLSVEQILEVFANWENNNNVNVPSASRTNIQIGNRTYRDPGFLAHLMNLVSVEGKRILSPNPDKQRLLLQEISKHPVWGNGSPNEAIQLIKLQRLVRPVAILGSANEEIAYRQKNEAALQNPSIRTAINERTGKQFTSFMVTAYNDFIPTGNLLVANNLEGLHEIIGHTRVDSQD